MRVRSINPAVTGIPALIDVSPEKKPQSNWITILTGQNGSCKSVLLRALLAGTFSDRVATISKEIPRIVFYKGNEPPQVITVSGTPINRFPPVAGIPIARRQTSYDVFRYRHFGPQGTSSLSTRSRAGAEIVHSLISDPDRTFARREQVIEILGKLGYSAKLRVTFVRYPADERHRDLSFQQIHRTMGRLNVEGDRGSVLRNFLSDFLADKAMQRVFLDYFSTSNSLDINLNERDSLKLSDSPFPPEDIAMFIETNILKVSTLAFGARQISDKNPTKNKFIRSAYLSSGQWQLLTGLLNVAVQINDNSLVLIDEPENSLHPEWQREYINMLGSALKATKGCHIIIATHSPFVASGVKSGEGNIIRLHRDNDIDDVEVLHEGEVFGWLPEDVLQKVFGLDSTRTPQLEELANKALRLIAEDRNQHASTLKTLAKQIEVIAPSLPETDPLRPALEVLVKLAYGEDVEAEE